MSATVSDARKRDDTPEPLKGMIQVGFHRPVDDHADGALRINPEELAKWLLRLPDQATVTFGNGYNGSLFIAMWEIELP